MSASWLPPQRGQLQEPPTQVSGSIERHAPLTSRSLPLAGLADVVDDEDDRAAQPGVVEQDVRVEPPPSTTRPAPSIFLMSSARAGMCLWRSLTRWQKLAEGCNIQVPMEAVSLINDGKNLDEFTRDVLNSCITKNQITKGKTAFSSIQ